MIGLIMLLCLFVILMMALGKVGGLSGLFSGLAAAALETIKWNNGRTTGDATFYIINYWLGSSLGFFAQPQAIQKFLTINSDKKTFQLYNFLWI